MRSDKNIMRREPEGRAGREQAHGRKQTKKEKVRKQKRADGEKEERKRERKERQRTNFGVVSVN